MNNNYIASPAINCDTSRRYHLMLQKLDEQQAKLEGTIGIMTIAEYHRQFQALEELRREIKEAWEKSKEKRGTSVT